jgi:hypothetical protein
MKQLVALVAAVAASSVFAQAKPAEAPKAAPAKKEEAKKDAKSDKKAEAAKK